MSQILDATLNKVITAWTVGPGRIEFELDGDALFRVDAVLDEKGEVDVLFGFPDDDEDDEQPQEPAASDRYAALLETVQNVYSHTVEIDTATGALVCRGCQRENIDLAKESCGE